MPECEQRKHVLNSTAQSVICALLNFRKHVKSPFDRRSSDDTVEHIGLTYLGYFKKSAQQNSITNVKLEAEIAFPFIS